MFKEIDKGFNAAKQCHLEAQNKVNLDKEFAVMSCIKELYKVLESALQDLDSKQSLPDEIRFFVGNPMQLQIDNYTIKVNTDELHISNYGNIRKHSDLIRLCAEFISIYNEIAFEFGNINNWLDELRELYKISYFIRYRHGKLMFEIYKNERTDYIPIFDVLD